MFAFADLRDDVPRSQNVKPNVATNAFAGVIRCTSMLLKSFCGLLISQVPSSSSQLSMGTFLVDEVGTVVQENHNGGRVNETKMRDDEKSRKVSAFGLEFVDDERNKAKRWLWCRVSDVALAIRNGLSLPVRNDASLFFSFFS